MNLEGEIKRDKFNTPKAVERWNIDMFVKTNIYKSNIDYAPIYINPKLFEEFFNTHFEWESAEKTIREYFSITLDKQKTKNPNPVGCAYVDLQRDSSDIALNGNKGSGRAFYVDSYFNVKGEKTPLATSVNQIYNNGHFALTSAIFEAIVSNVIAQDFETGCFETLAILDTKESFDFGWSKGKIACGQIIRIERNGQLDRITHLYQNNRALSENDFIEMAKKIGILEGEKFIEKILHGAWSAGNVSILGNMIDLETLCAVEGRHPQFSFTNRYKTNFFGYEYLGQIMMLSDLSESQSNADKVKINQIQDILLESRKKKMVEGFQYLMGLENINLEEYEKQIVELVELFEQLSRSIFPNLSSLGVWDHYCEATFTLDFSRFFRLYPILKINNLYTLETALELLINQKAVELEEQYCSEAMVSDSVKEFFCNQEIIEETKESFFETLEKASIFIQKYDELYKTLMDKYNADKLTFEKNAYLYNETRRMISQKDNVKLNLVTFYQQGRISGYKLNKLINYIIKYSLRKSENEKTNIRLFLEGSFGIYLDGKGCHYIEFIIFKDSLNIIVNNEFSILVNGKKYKCELEYCIDGDYKIKGPLMNNSLLIEEYREIYLYSGNQKVRLTTISAGDREVFHENNFAKLL